LVIVSAAIAEMEFDHTSIGANAYIAKGPFDEMAENVLKAVTESEFPQRASEPKPIKGLKSVDGVPIHARQMTKELLSINRHLENILGSISEGILEIYHGTIIYANAGAVALFGISQEELLARYFAELFDPLDQERVKALLAPHTGKSVDIGPDNPVKFNDRHVIINNFPIKGKTATSVVLITDVTNQNRLQFHQNHTRKMEAVTRVVKRVTKDFRRQLQRIQQTTTDMLQKMDAGSPHLQKIEQVNRHLADLYHQFSVSAGVGKSVTKEPSVSIQKGTEVIFLTDNNVITREFNRLILEEVGYKILIAKTGEEVVEKYRIRSANKYNKIDLVIVDINLPDMATDELCDRLRQINPGLKILISGEFTLEDHEKSALPLDAGYLIQKPFNIYQVSSKLREILDTE
jgi:PAS domain S-box-containing protein